MEKGANWKVVEKRLTNCGAMDINTQIYVNRVKTFEYVGSTVVCDGELDDAVTYRVQSGWKNLTRVPRVLCDRIIGIYMNIKRKTSTGVRARDIEDGTR